MKCHFNRALAIYIAGYELQTTNLCLCKSKFHACGIFKQSRSHITFLLPKNKNKTTTQN